MFDVCNYICKTVDSLGVLPKPNLPFLTTAYKVCSELAVNDRQ